MDDSKTSPVSFFLTPLHDSDSCTRSQTFPSGPVSAECRSLQNYTTRLSAGYKAFFPLPLLSFATESGPLSVPVTLLYKHRHTACAQKRPDMHTHWCPVSTFWPPSFRLSLRLSSYLPCFTKGAGYRIHSDPLIAKSNQLSSASDEKIRRLSFPVAGWDDSWTPALLKL